MFQKITQFLTDHPWTISVLMSLGLFAGVMLIRWTLLNGVRRMPIKSQELRRRWVLAVRNLALMLLFIGLALIWAEQLRTLAISLLAIIVAVVLSTKELILCLTGSFLKASAGTFSIGDRIEVNKLRGDVIDQTLLSTTLMEVGPGESIHQHSGRVLVIPNSLFLSTPVMNENFTGHYAVHSFTVPIKRDDDYLPHEQALLAAAAEVCAPYLEAARKSMAYLTATESVDAPSVEPRVTISIPANDRIDLVVRVAAPVQRKGRTEQQILRKYLANLPAKPPEQDSASPEPMS